MANKDPLPALSIIMDLIHQRLLRVTETARAAKACADVNNVDEAVRITLSLDQPIFEVKTLLSAASTIRRLSRGDDDFDEH